MFRRNTAPIPRPADPSAASSDANYLSAQIQQLLAMVLPEPIVTILATISDLIYRALLGKPNDPPTYTSTLVPPLLLVLVTYLSVLFVYRSVKSFFGFLIFSLKWAVVLSILGVLVAYHLGNGNVEQGARLAAQRSGLHVQGQDWTSALQRYPAAQQVAPYLSQASKSLGGVSAAVPFMQSVSQRVLEMVQGGGADVGTSANQGKGRDRIVREYRDIRPQKKRYSFAEEDRSGPSDYRKSARSVSNPAIDSRRRTSQTVKTDTYDSSGDTAMGRIARFMGADFGSAADSSSRSRSKQKSD